MAVTELDLRRVHWHCRRGLLENDLMLDRFFVRHAHRLDADGLVRLQRLLGYEDHDLWDVLSGRVGCGDPGLQEMVDLIRAG